MKLRKHIRTQRLEDVRQVGMDRVVDFKFGSGKASNHVILELYASGDSDGRIAERFRRPASPQAKLWVV